MAVGCAASLIGTTMSGCPRMESRVVAVCVNCCFVFMVSLRLNRFTIFIFKFEMARKLLLKI